MRCWFPKQLPHFTFPTVMHRVLTSPHPCQHKLFSFLFLMIVTIEGMQWYLIMVLICIYLMTNDSWLLFMYRLAIPVYSLEKCLFRWFLNWVPHAKSWLIGKVCDAGRDWGQEEKGTTEDEMAGWRHWLPWTWVWVNSGTWWWTGRPACCSLWGRRVGHDWATELNWTDLS